MLLINIVYEHYFSYVAASLPIAQLAGIGVVVIVISLPTSFAILAMCYIRRKRRREKNSMNTCNFSCIFILMFHNFNS